jgi:hypothetical protein
MDAKRKADLRRSHFDVGKETPAYTSTAASSYRPQTANQNPYNSQRARELRQENFSLGERPTSSNYRQGVTPYMTNNMINFKWV